MCSERESDENREKKSECGQLKMNPRERELGKKREKEREKNKRGKE